MEQGKNQGPLWALAGVIIGFAIWKVTRPARLPPKEEEISIDDNPRKTESSASHIHDPTKEEQIHVISHHPNPQEPPTHEKEWQAKQERSWRRERRPQWAMFGISFAGVIIAIYTLVILNKQTQIALDTLHMQRPHISLGRADGEIAEYLPPGEGEEKGSIVLYFQNTGPVAATRFLTNISSSVSPDPTQKKPQQIYRYNLLREGKRIYGETIGPTIGANSTHPVALDAQAVPTADQWALIQSGQRPEGFSVSGTFEYCDLWGEHHCEAFTAYYLLPPGNRFVRSYGMPCPTFPLPDLREAPGDEIEFLPRCKQPREQEPSHRHPAQ